MISVQQVYDHSVTDGGVASEEGKRGGMGHPLYTESLFSPRLPVLSNFGIGETNGTGRVQRLSAGQMLRRSSTSRYYVSNFDRST